MNLTTEMNVQSLLVLHGEVFLAELKRSHAIYPIKEGHDIGLYVKSALLRYGPGLTLAQLADAIQLGLIEPYVSLPLEQPVYTSKDMLDTKEILQKQTSFFAERMEAPLPVFQPGAVELLDLKFPCVPDIDPDDLTSITDDIPEEVVLPVPTKAPAKLQHVDDLFASLFKK